MVKEFQEELKSFLNTFATTQIYLGEFDDPEELELVTKTTPMMFIDFIGDEVGDFTHKTTNWNLYFLGVTSNKAELYRQKSQSELLDFMERVDKELEAKSFFESNPVELVSLKKMFDGITEHGYLTIYKRSFKATLYSNS